MQSEQKNPDAVEQSREQVLELGSDLTKGKNGNIYTLTVIGQIEGHQTLPETAKTTKYEHVLPLLAGIEESDEIDGLLLLLNTVGGDIEAGLAIAELIAGMKKLPGPGGRTLHRRPSGGVCQTVLHRAYGQHDHSPGANDWAGGGRASDLPVLQPDSGADCGLCHRQLQNLPGGF